MKMFPLCGTERGGRGEAGTSGAGLRDAWLGQGPTGARWQICRAITCCTAGTVRVLTIRILYIFRYSTDSSASVNTK